LALIDASQDCVNATQISDRLNFSRNTVAKVLQALTRYNFIVSTRGPKGGFKLNKPASGISILDVLEIMDGKFSDEHCRGDIDVCPFETCVYGDERHKWFKEFKAYYSNRTIQDFRLKEISDEKRDN
jgi:Rrf2 family protein